MSKELALEMAAQAWCQPTTQHKVMDVELCEAFAQVLENWIDTAKQHARNEEFYHGLVTQIGENFGVAARTSDDGTIQDEVLALRVPELVAELIAMGESDDLN